MSRGVERRAGGGWVPGVAVALLASCASAPHRGPAADELATWPSVLEAEIDAVTRVAARVPDRCSQLELVRFGGAMAFSTLPPTVERAWQIVACERVLDVTLECADQPGAAHCWTRQASFPDREDADLRRAFFSAALREAIRLEGRGTCTEGLAARSVPGSKRTGDVDIEGCGASKRVSLTCDGTPVRCAVRGDDR